MDPYDVIPDDIPLPGCPAPCPILDDVADLPYSLAYEDNDGARWVITAEEDARLDRAAQYGITLLSLGKRHTIESRSARQTLRNLGISYWQHGSRTIIPRLQQRSQHTAAERRGQHVF